MTAKKKTTKKGKTRTKNSRKSTLAQKTHKSLKFQDWMLPTAKILASQGLNTSEIAHKLGIHPSTLYRYMASDDIFCEAIAQGKGLANQMVEDALFSLCVGFGDQAPNQRSIEFWLKNRAKDRWSDTQQVEQTTTVVHTLDVQQARQALLSEPPVDEDDPIDVEPLDG